MARLGPSKVVLNQRDLRQREPAFLPLTAAGPDKSRDAAAKLLEQAAKEQQKLTAELAEQQRLRRSFWKPLERASTRRWSTNEHQVFGWKGPVPMLRRTSRRQA
jgi:hypothetical protein